MPAMLTGPPPPQDAELPRRPSLDPGHPLAGVAPARSTTP